MEFRESDVHQQINTALSTLQAEDTAEIAFFGGSFTGIDRELMVRLLELAEEYVTQGRVTSIRLSTRPDYISEEILEILSHYSVHHIELGLQSMDDAVLQASKRGHTVRDGENACRMVLQAGFSLVGQMMIGLPSSTPEAEMETARRICELGASAVRIYPTVVFYETELCEMAKSGLYEPISLEDAVIRCARVFEKFYEAGVTVIRIGLHSSENLTSSESCFGGPNHPALGELVINEFFFERISKKLMEYDLKNKTVKVCVAKGALSKAVGQKQKNKKRLAADFQADIIFSESDLLSNYDYSVEIVGKERTKDVFKIS
jgi:histone acetyltransferase (RNA polymerase elongator complex component)